MEEFISQHWFGLLKYFIFVVWIIYRFIPTRKDDPVIRIVFNLFTFVFPDRRKGGGKHW